MLGTNSPNFISFVTGWELVPFEYDADPTLQVGAIVAGLDQQKMAGSFCVHVRFEKGPIRWRVDGGEPQGNPNPVGLPGFDGDQQLLSAWEANRLKMVREGVTNGKVYVTPYRLVHNPTQ